MIAGMRIAVPKNILDRSGYDPVQLKNFERVTGIVKTRRWEGSASALAIEAARPFGQLGNLIQAVVVVTQSQDRKSPCMAMDLHGHLKLGPNVPAFDVNQSCDGLVYGIWLASKLHVTTLVVCVDMLRAREGTTDALIFSDAACAIMVQPSEQIFPPHFLTDASGVDVLKSDKDGFLCMNGGAVFDFVTKNVPPLIQKYDGLMGPFDLLAQHQPNESMMGLVEKRSGFGSRSLRSIREYGNQSMVSIATAIAANENQCIGKKILLCGYGAGWAAGVIGVKWLPYEVCKILEV